jgi:hypothetical protein
VIRIPTIRLQWSDWFHWDELKIDARRGGVLIPGRPSGEKQDEGSGWTAPRQREGKDARQLSGCWAACVNVRVLRTPPGLLRGQAR